MKGDINFLIRQPIISKVCILELSLLELLLSISLTYFSLCLKLCEVLHRVVVSKWNEKPWFLRFLLHKQKRKKRKKQFFIKNKVVFITFAMQNLWFSRSNFLFQILRKRLPIWKCFFLIYLEMLTKRKLRIMTLIQYLKKKMRNEEPSLA